MEQKEQLSRALRKIFWAYILLYFDINLGTIDILPAWIGYIFLNQTISDCIEKEESSAKLLKPICLILTIYRLIDWFVAMLGLEMNLLIVSEVFSVVALYFHFQFLTNLANIARKYDCPIENTLLALRTVHTVMMTILTFTMHFSEIEWLSLMIMVAQVFITIFICFVIGRFRRILDENIEN